MNSIMRRLAEIRTARDRIGILFGNMSDFSTFEKLPLASGWRFHTTIER